MKKSVLLPETGAEDSVLYKPKKGKRRQIAFLNELLVCLAHVNDITEEQEFGHGWRVAVVAARLAQKLDPALVDRAFYAGLLHDIGMAGSGKHILNYRDLGDQLSDPDIKNHPYRGAEWTRPVPVLCQAADLIYEHHEHFDGSGYPTGRKGGDLLPGSQLVRAADGLDFWLAKQATKSSARTENGQSRFVGFYKSFDKTANRELGEDVLYALFELMREDDLCQAALRDENLPLVVQEVSDYLSGIEVPGSVDLFGTVLKLLGDVIDSKLPYSAGHSKRVAQYALSLATTLNLDHETVTTVKWAGLIHDIGKVGIPAKILMKPGPLKPKEWRVVKAHPTRARERVSIVHELSEVGRVVGSFSEHYDGRGYPDKLKGEKIPIGARVLAVAEALDAMTSERPYRTTWTVQDAVRELLEQSGKQFDPEVAKAANLVFGS